MNPNENRSEIKRELENQISGEELTPRDLDSVHGGQSVPELPATFYTEYASNFRITEK